MVNKFKSKKGFTLIELLVVIAIIGILAVVAVPALFKNIQKAKIADLESEYNAIKSAVLSFYSDGNKLEYSPLESSSNLNEYIDNKIAKTPIGGMYYIVPQENINFTNGYMFDGKETKEVKDFESYLKSNFEVVLRIMDGYGEHLSNGEVKISETQFKKLSNDIGHDNVFSSNKTFNSSTKKDIYIGLVPRR